LANGTKSRAYAGGAFIAGVSPNVRLLPSKTRPKRIDFIASNGQAVRFLLKGGEDLQQEQRMQQLLSCLNACVQSYQSSCRANTQRVGRPGDAGDKLRGMGVTWKAESSDLCGLVLNVTPLGPGMGVVQWVPRSFTLFDVFKGWQARMLQRHATAAEAAATAPPQPPSGEHATGRAARAGTGSTGTGNTGRDSRGRTGKGAAQSDEIAMSHRIAVEAATQAVLALDSDSFPTLAGSRTSTSTVRASGHTAAPAVPPRRAAVAATSPAAPVSDIVMLKPTELFYAVLQATLRDASLPAQLPRKLWPPAVLLNVFKTLLRKAPAQLLANELWASANDAPHWWAMRRRYTSTLALSSIASYLLGIGDRHLNNVLIVQGSGQIVHIDSAVCFDQGASLRVPEVVPFRLTQLLVTALGPMGAQVCPVATTKSPPAPSVLMHAVHLHWPVSVYQCYQRTTSTKPVAPTAADTTCPKSCAMQSFGTWMRSCALNSRGMWRSMWRTVGGALFPRARAVRGFESMKRKASLMCRNIALHRFSDRS
jgi:hypothetical protein